MAVKLRLRRMGRKKHPVYALVAADTRSPRDGRFIEDLGRYEPVADPAVVRLNDERILYWLQQGAQPSDTARNLLSREGLMLRLHLTRKGKTEEEIEQAVTEFKAQRGESEASKTTAADRRAAALEAERKAAAEAAKKAEEERKAREAELEKQRQEAEAAERAARAAAAAEAACEESDAETSAPDAEAQAEIEAAGDEGADEAVAETTEADVAEAAPEAAEEQPAVEDASSEAVADETGEDVAAQTEAGAEEEPAAEEVPAATPAEEAQAPAEDEAPAAETTENAAEADDLTTIWGVGPTYAGILQDAGLTTFGAVAEKSVEEIQALITEAGSTTAGNEETWPEQARLLAAGDTEGHAAYVEELKNA